MTFLSQNVTHKKQQHIKNNIISWSALHIAH